MALVSYSATMTAGATQVLIPAGLETPYGRCVRVSGGELREITEHHTQQKALLMDVTGDQLKIEFTFDTVAANYPETIFQPKQSKYTRYAGDLVSEIQEVAGDLEGYALLKRIACHVAERFTYAHPDIPFNNATDIIPAIGCGMVEGSCVDINTYFLAALRSAGVEAGYVTGFFFPEEKANRCDDGHCWVVTRLNGETLEWDIAHHLKMGTREIDAGLNPKPGKRFGCFHSMGLDFPDLKIHDLKALIEPLQVNNGKLSGFISPKIELIADESDCY